MDGGSDRHAHLRSPVACMGIFGVTLDLPDPVGSVEIPPLPAITWVEILSDETFALTDVLRLCRGSVHRDVLSMMVRRQVSLTEVNEVLQDAITQASGRPWWEALNLTSIALASWDELVGGELALHGVDATRIGLGAWLDAVWLTLRRNVRDDQAMRTLVSAVRTRPRPVGEEEGMYEDEFEQAMMIAS